MARYIDADELLKIKFKNPIGLTAFQNIVKRQPTADVKPVVRGEWIYKNDNITIPTGYWECSICGKGKLLYEQNFCPYCGADMRGGNDVRITD